MNSSVRICLAAIFVLLPVSQISAQRDLNIDRYRPSPGVASFSTMPGSHVPDRGDYDLALFLNYQRSPLQFTSRGDTNSVVRDRLGGVIVGQLGLGHSLALTLSTPLVLYQYGDAASLADGGP
ncbi:MAG: hypothetical protein AAF550_11055, partial [Myxococcota bacterium]